jgi:hypothetical protein
MEILIASHPDKENLVAEIWIADVLVAEISEKGSIFEIQLFSDGNISLALDEFLEAIDQSKLRLSA